MGKAVSATELKALPQWELCPHSIAAGSSALTPPRAWDVVHAKPRGLGELSLSRRHVKARLSSGRYPALCPISVLDPSTGGFLRAEEVPPQQL